MQLIKNDQEREQAGLPRLIWLCGACDEELCLHYPVLIMGDRNRTGYHLACAAQVASEISDAIADYLSEQSSAQAEEEELSAMAKAFREAARQRR